MRVCIRHLERTVRIELLSPYSNLFFPWMMGEKADRTSDRNKNATKQQKSKQTRKEKEEQG